MNISSPIQNPDLLLSCAIDQNANDFPLTEHSYSILNSPTNFNSMIETEFITSNAAVPRFQFEQQIEQDSLSLDSHKDIKEEILDFNIFELLQHEEPEIAKLIDPINYLPQISVNTATRILDNAATTSTSTSLSSTLKSSNSSNSMSTSSLSSVLMELHKSSQLTSDLAQVETNLMDIANDKIINSNISSKPSLFRLEDLDQSQMSASFKELCDLLSIKKSTESDLEKSKYLTPPLTPTDVPTKTRTSMRLIYKKQKSLKNELVKQEPQSVLNTTSKRAKRKRPSFHLDSDDASDEEDNAIKAESNVKLNSIEDYSNDQIYEDDQDNDDEDDDSIDSNSENSSNGGYPCMTKAGRIGQSKRESKAGENSILDPIKKESNKEAATRYRLKKISEKDKLFETRSGLEKENDFVKRKIELVQTEINYLKNILVQMILTKSLINNGNN